MADDKPKRLSREVFLRLGEGMRTKVRYGRATLTVDRAVAVVGTPIGEALAAHRRGEIDAEEVARRFLREQAVSHSPTFDWGSAKLDKLLPRVTAVTREPDLKAQTPDELVAELKKVEADEKAAMKRLSEQIRKYTFPAGGDYMKIMQRAQADMQLFNKHNRMLQQHSEMIQKAMRPMRIHDELAKRNQQQLAQIQKALQPTLTLDAFGLSQSKIQKMLGLAMPKSITELPGLKNPFLEQDWRPVFERVAEAAREAESPDIAEAVEVTASEAEKGGPEVDFEAMREAIEGLTEQLKETNRLNAEKAEKEEGQSGAGSKGNSFSRQLLIQLSLMMIRWMFEAVLPIQLGVPFPVEPSEPPEAPEPPEPPEDGPTPV
jgi:hypothetical protein